MRYILLPVLAVIALILFVRRLILNSYYNRRLQINGATMYGACLAAGHTEAAAALKTKYRL